MKIITQTADRLVVTTGNTFWVVFGSMFILGGCVLGIGLGTTPGIPLILAVILFTAFVSAGLTVTLLVPKITLKVDKTMGQIFVTRHSIVRKKIETRAISEITAIKTIRDASIRDARVTMKQTFLVLKDGKMIPLDRKEGGSLVSVNSGSPMSFGKDTESLVAHQIASFLGVPYGR